QGDTRGDAIARIRRRAGREVSKRIGGHGASIPQPGSTGGPGGKRPRAATWYVGEWRKLADAVTSGPAPDVDDAVRSKDALRLAARQRAEALVAEAIG